MSTPQPTDQPTDQPTEQPTERPGSDTTRDTSTSALCDLVARARTGDEEAWSTLVSDHTRLLRSVARRHRLTADQTDDATQATWLALLGALGAIRQPERLAGWLSVTMGRECLAVLRRRRWDRPFDDADSDTATDRSESGRSSPEASAEHRLIDDERRAAVRRAVALLPPRQQLVVGLLTASPTPSYAEVAGRLSIAVGTIGPTRVRALHRLRRLLQPDVDQGLLDATG